MCSQRRLRSAWDPDWAESSLTVWRKLVSLAPTERKENTLIIQGGCPGWSEFSLGARAILLVLSCAGSNVKGQIDRSIWPIYNVNQFCIETHIHLNVIRARHNTAYCDMLSNSKPNNRYQDCIQKCKVIANLFALDSCTEWRAPTGAGIQGNTRE